MACVITPTRWALAATAALGATAAGACEDEAMGTDRAVRWVEARREPFERFERWARRAMVADSVLRQRGALRETLFAPIRDDTRVAAAWVARGDEHVLSWRGRKRPPDDVAWARVEDGMRGTLRVATARLPAREDGGDRDRISCVLVSRTRAAGGGSPVRVTVAYRRGEGL